MARGDKKGERRRPRHRWLGPHGRSALRRIGRFVSWEERHPQALFWLVFTLLFLINVFDSFGLDDVADRALAEVIDSVAGPFYGSGHAKLQDYRLGQKNIVIVLIDEQSLADFGQDGIPISYRMQSEILSKVAAARPRAIFWDGYYPKPRAAAAAVSAFGAMGGAKISSDDDMASLATTMERIGAHTPLLIGPVARSDARSGETYTALAPLRALLDKNKALPFSRGVHEVWLDVDQNHVREYLSSGPGFPASSQKSAPQLPSAAVALFRAYCATPTLKAEVQKCPSDPVSDIASPFIVQWGMGVSPWRSALIPQAFQSRCSGGAGGFGSFFSYVGRGLFRQLHQPAESLSNAPGVQPADASDGDDLTVGARCGYHDVIPVSALDGADAAGVPMADHLKGKLVLIGLDLTASGDRRTVPFYGNVAGVLTHAMAIDNLIETGGIPAAKPRPVWLGIDELDILHYVGMIATICILALTRKKVQQLFVSRDTIETRENLVIGFVCLVLICVAGAAIFYGVWRHWPLSSILFSGMLPGGILAIGLLLCADVSSEVGAQHDHEKKGGLG